MNVVIVEDVAYDEKKVALMVSKSLEHVNQLSMDDGLLRMGLLG
jgi:hypothetical protein